MKCKVAYKLKLQKYGLLASLPYFLIFKLITLNFPSLSISYFPFFSSSLFVG
jgi:hypothetical protein